MAPEFTPRFKAWRGAALVELNELWPAADKFRSQLPGRAAQAKVRLIYCGKTV